MKVVDIQNDLTTALNYSQISNKQALSNLLLLLLSK